MKNNILYNYMYQKAYLRKTPLSIMIELLTRCNLNCKHCYLPDHVDDGLDLDIIKNVVNQFRNMGGLNVSLTGGEIFLRKDIIDIISYIRSLQMRVILLSNGTLLNESIVDKLADLCITEFSTTIFSLDNTIHDEITGVPGSLQRVLKNLRILKKAGIRVQIKTPLMKANMNDFEIIREFCKENKFNFHVSPLIFEKLDGNKEPLKLRIPTEDLQKIIFSLDSETRNKHIYVNDVPCAALHFSFAMNCRGDIYPCNSFFCKVGNIFENSLQEIWYESKILNQIRSMKKSDLPQCINCELKEECDRCPGMVFSSNGNFYGCDNYAKSIAKLRKKE